MLHHDISDETRRNDVKRPEDNGYLPKTGVLSITQIAIKRIIDIGGAVLFFAVLGPVYIAVAIGIWITGEGPIHYKQTRLGKNGRPFSVYKFRSMVVNAEQVLEKYLAQDPDARAQWETFQKLNNDPRVIPIGKFIRRFSLDELPQFWNVLRGDMSLIGPRPCINSQRDLYGSAWEHYTAMRPGLTGLWQVSGRNKLSFAQRVTLDAEYVNCWSLVLDVKILLKTFRAVIVDGN